MNEEEKENYELINELLYMVIDRMIYLIDNGKYVEALFYLDEIEDIIKKIRRL